MQQIRVYCARILPNLLRFACPLDYHATLVKSIVLEKSRLYEPTTRQERRVRRQNRV